jgi:2-alkenal reductase
VNIGEQKETKSTIGRLLAPSMLISEEYVCASIGSRAWREEMMHRWRYGILIITLFALALAGCDRSLVALPAEQPTGSVARPTAPAQATTVPVAAQRPAQPTSAPPEALAQTLQNLEEIARVHAHVFDRVAPAVVRVLPGQGLGSGFLIDRDGQVVTNHHVVAGGNGRVRVAFTGLFETYGEVVGADPDSDIAVVKVDQLPERITPVELGNSDQIQVGQQVIAIGNPFGQERTVTVGIVSALGRTISEPASQYSIGGAIQTDAAINPGNSGGPLLDLRGRVIGMNTAGLSPSGGSTGIGFAVPVNLIAKVAPDLIAQRYYNHPWLGIQIGGEITTLVAEQQNLPAAGLLVRPDSTGSRQPGAAGRAARPDHPDRDRRHADDLAGSDDLIPRAELSPR